MCWAPAIIILWKKFHETLTPLAPGFFENLLFAVFFTVVCKKNKWNAVRCWLSWDYILWKLIPSCALLTSFLSRTEAAGNSAGHQSREQGPRPTSPARCLRGAEGERRVSGESQGQLCFEGVGYYLPHTGTYSRSNFILGVIFYDQMFCRLYLTKTNGPHDLSLMSRTSNPVAWP